jgi:acyl-CoA synthetase (AMP-forming)/AMP-acid ligase II
LEAVGREGLMGVSELVSDLRTFDQVPAQYGKRTPDAVAIRHGQRAITWAELDRSTNQIANQLIAQGITDGQRFAYLGRNSVEWLQLIFAAAKSRSIMVSVNWRLTPAEMALILNDSGARILVVTRDFLAAARDLRVGLAPTVKGIYALGAPETGFDDFEAWLSAGGTECPGLPTAQDDTLCLCYTSGTTGAAKGAEMTHRTFVETKLMAADVCDVLVPYGDQCALDFMPPFHSNGINLAYACLSQGCQLILMDEWDVEQVLRILNSYPVKTLPAVPTMLRMLLDHPMAARTDFRHLEYVNYGAAPMPTSLVRRAISAIDCKFVQVYGLTENPVATMLGPEDHSAAGGPEMAPVGRPLPRVELRIVIEGGDNAAIGETGEIWLRSPGAMKGYWNNPEATAVAVNAEGWLRTGDAAFMDGKGYVHLRDRITDTIISGGENIYPAEVENVLCGHASVKEVAVIGVPDIKWGEIPIAVVVPVTGATIHGAELTAFARERLASYKLPKRIEVADDLPRNASNKVLRRVLRQQYAGVADGDPTGRGADRQAAPDGAR